MKLDIPTILFMLVMISGLIGSVFMSAWLRRRSEIYLRAGSAGLLMAIGLALLIARGVIPDRVSIDIANALTLIGVGLAWSAVRLFEGRQAPTVVVLAGGVLWLVACAWPPFYDVLAYRIGFQAAISAAYAFAAGYEFSRAGGKALRARRALALTCTFQGFFVLFRGGYTAFVDAPASLFEGKGSLVHGVLIAEPVLMLIVLAMLGVGLMREEAETHLRRRADTDPLTGVLNRRAFFLLADQALALARRDGRPIALLLFDLDHFKAINDRHGHLMGDLALTAFTTAVGNVVRSTDFVGRIGGEEFAVLVSGAEAATAASIAERIRFDFSRATISLDGKPVGATVSAGIAVARGAHIDLKALVTKADRALYGAKHAGRNRVHSALALAS
jgi:diguanylate cyclase (GGDEF)-like protein